MIETPTVWTIIVFFSDAKTPEFFKIRGFSVGDAVCRWFSENHHRPFVKMVIYP